MGHLGQIAITVAVILMTNAVKIEVVNDRQADTPCFTLVKLYSVVFDSFEARVQLSTQIDLLAWVVGEVTTGIVALMSKANIL